MNKKPVYPKLSDLKSAKYVSRFKTESGFKKALTRYKKTGQLIRWWIDSSWCIEFYR